MVLKEIMKYISNGNTLPTVICNWLETVPMQDEFKKFISIDVDANKSDILISCLKLKGDLSLSSIHIKRQCIIVFFFFFF